MAENTKTENTMIFLGNDEDDDDGFVLESGRKLKPRPPPFLTKTYEMVDDPETNSYIAWNSSGTGFVIFDHNKFSSHVLPNIFRTSNFSSFVYQLNSYGFRKISWERYEYANQWFQAGKKHWLVNIKRRNQQTDWSQSGKKRARSTPDPISTHVSVETKLDAVTTGQSEMKQKIQSLKQSLDIIESQLTSLEDEVPMFPDEKTRIAVFVKGFVEEFLKRKKVDENSEENSDRVLSVSKSPVQDQAMEKEKGADITENPHSWIEMLVEDEEFDPTEFADLHSKAMFQLDEMIASDLALQPGVKASGLQAEDDNNGHLELWM